MKTSLTLFILIFSFATLSCESDEQKSESDTGPANQPAVNEWTAGDLRGAALSGDLQVVNESLEQGISVDDTDELGRTALMFAGYNGHNDVVNALIENEADVNLENDEGRTSLMFAASGPFSETVSLLLENGADVNRSDAVEEWTPLMYAAAEGNSEVVELLLEHGANSAAEDSDGETAADFAENNGHTQTAALLRDSLNK
jgi:ankyrin repeat protein